MRPGGGKRVVIYCDRCQDEYPIGVVVTPAGTVAGAHIRQLVFHCSLTVYGSRLLCHPCVEAERLQLDIRHG